jgi:hypothetical protein
VPYFQILEEYDYGGFGAVGLRAASLPRFAEGTQYGNDLIDMMDHCARRGWLMVLMDHAMATSREFWDALPVGPGRKTFIVPTDAAVDIMRFRTRPGTFCVEYAGNVPDTIRSAAKKMLAVTA